MEFALIAAAIAAVLYANHKSQASSSGVPPQPTPPGPDPTPPTPPRPPPPSGPLPPGVYPAGTPGAIPVILYVQGGDNDAKLYATPGSYAGPLPPKTVTVWYGPGTLVSFKAVVDPGFIPISLTAFDHFEGPGGATTRQNPFTQEIRSTGYVRAVFSFLGRVGG